MSFYNTGNPVPSIDPRDLDDNAKHLDTSINSQEDTWVDRLGATRKSIKGIENGLAVMQAGFDEAQANRAEEFQEFLLDSGYETPVDYATGISITRSTQIVRYLSELYRPKIADLPFTTTTFPADAAKWIANGDNSLRQELITPASGSNMVAAPGAGSVAQALGMVSVTQYGGTGTGNETAIFLSSVAAAVTAGHKRVFIPFPAFAVNAGVDCQGCEIYGSDTDLTGYLINHKGLFNIKAFTINQSLSTKSDEIPVDRTPKLLWRQSATNDYCIIQKPRGYALLGFAINSTTTSESLATTTSEPTRRRLAEVLDAIWAGVYKFTFSAESGTWTTQSIANPVNIIPTYTSGRALTSRFTTQNGSYAEYLIFPKNGTVQFALFTGTSSTATATVSVNGTLAATIAPVSAVSSTIKVYNISALGNPDSQAVTVRVTHTGTNGTRLQMIGANFYELKDWDGTENDTFAYFRNSAWADYLTQSSANDCVIREFNSNLYGISYHGGETGIVSEWYSNHATVAPAVDGYVVSRDLVHKNKADVSWAAFGGGAITIRADWIPRFGGVSHAARVTGNIVVNELYTHMFGTPESFTECVEPRYVDFTGVSNGVRTPVGRTTNVTMRNPTTGQEIRSHMSIYEREQNRYGGVHIWKVVGSYLKQYGAISLNGKMVITDLSLVSGFSFW